MISVFPCKCTILFGFFVKSGRKCWSYTVGKSLSLSEKVSYSVGKSPSLPEKVSYTVGMFPSLPEKVSYLVGMFPSLPEKVSYLVGKPLFIAPTRNGG